MGCDRSDKAIHAIWFALGEIVAVGTLAAALFNKAYGHIGLCVMTLVLVAVPFVFEYWSNRRMHTAVFALLTAYALGPLFGGYYGWYHITSWWDKTLHALGGVVFAIVGIWLFVYFGQIKGRVWMCALFALCLSVTAAAVWECFEFGCDRLLGTDMQHDTVITSLHSYIFGDAMGNVGALDGIVDVTVNGKTLPVNGYLDIGLIDTMYDILVEVLGAAVVSVVYLLSQGHLRVFHLRSGGVHE